MKVLILLLTIILSNTIIAGTGHGHSHEKRNAHAHSAPAISKDKTKEIGKFHLDRLIEEKKIDSSWKNAIYKDSLKKVFSGKEEWVVTFSPKDSENQKLIKETSNAEKPKDEKTLFIFLKISGEFIAANFTGK